MDNEILDATLVDSDEEQDFDEAPRRRRQKGGYAEPRSRRAQEVPDDDDYEGGDDDDDGYDDAGGDDDDMGDDPDEDYSDDGGGNGRQVRKAQVVDKPSRHKPVDRNRSRDTGDEDDDDSSPNLMTIAVIVVVALLLLSTVYFVVLKDDDDLSNLVVNVPGLKEGDEGRYDVDGSIRIRDADSDPIGGEITEGSISLDSSNMVVEAEGIETVEDGYYHEYEALKTYTKTTWKVDGWVMTESYDRVNIEGSTRVESYAYRNGITILRNELSAETDIDAQSDVAGFYQKNFHSEDTLRTYSSDSGDLQASLDEVIHTKDLKKGMSGQFQNGEVSYSWEVTGAKHVYNADCVIVTFNLIEPIPDDYDIESQSIKLYLSNEYPIPVKTELEVVVASQGRVIIKNTITMSYFKRGTTDIVIPDDEVEKESPYAEKRIMDDEYPPHGTQTNSSISYTMRDAHEKAVDESDDLVDFLDSHPGSYIVQGIYNETDGPVWNLTYSYPEADNGYVVLVTESQVEDKGEMKLGDAGPALSVTAPSPEIVISWAGAEQILKHDDEIKDNCFNGERMDLGDCNFGVRTRLYQPSIDLVSMFAAAPRVDYGYGLTKDDEFAAGVDAETGQLLFVATHDGPQLF